jgi:hypothetical protein
MNYRITIDESCIEQSNLPKSIKCYEMSADLGNLHVMLNCRYASGEKPNLLKSIKYFKISTD